MERIKQMGLKKSLFTIAFIHITVALFLSAACFWGCMELSSAIAPQGIVIDVHSNRATVTELQEPTANAIQAAEIAALMQIVLPVLICTLALVSTASMFYRLKLREPLAVLTQGASRIMGNDLDFTVEAKSQDELGQLCAAFETMRKTLLENNHELWRQTEERKRLNAAFSHNLRNPVTVLKGSVKLAEKSIRNGGEGTGRLAAHLSLMQSYTDRIERYIETMSSVQTLGEIPLDRKNADWNVLISELENAVRLIGLDSGKQIQFETAAYPHFVLIDKSVLFQIVENLVSNALRYAESLIHVSCSVNGDVLELSVTDDGGGFPDALIKNGIQPFQQGSEDAEHFGMGLYISNLLAKKHGGNMVISNQRTGAAVTAVLKIK